MLMDACMMIGVGLVKDSDAVFFQYLGEDAKPRALTIPTSGKPVYKFQNVRLVGVDIAEDVGEFNSTKLNVYLESSAGNVVADLRPRFGLRLSCVHSLVCTTATTSTLASLSTAGKVLPKMRPCFASVKIDNQKISDDQLYDTLKELRADRASDKIMQVMRDSVEILRHALGIEAADVTVEETTDEEF